MYAVYREAIERHIIWTCRDLPFGICPDVYGATDIQYIDGVPKLVNGENLMEFELMCIFRMESLMNYILEFFGFGGMLEFANRYQRWCEIHIEGYERGIEFAEPYGFRST